MSRFVVLLRGVNVGKGNRLPMAGFRACLEALGYTGIRTLLNSGNAVFAAGGRDPARHATAIAAALQASFGIATPVIVRSAVEFAAILRSNPIVPPEGDHSRFLVGFAMDPDALLAVEALRPLLQPGERLAISGSALYLHCAGGLLDSPLAAALLGRSGRSLTTRNWATVLKLHALLDEGRA